MKNKKLIQLLDSEGEIMAILSIPFGMSDTSANVIIQETYKSFSSEEDPNGDIGYYEMLEKHDIERVFIDGQIILE
jgi:hypothetical protein